MPISQVNNEEMMRLAASRFRRLGDQIFAWGDVHNFVMSIPGLVGYWPGAVDIGTSRLLDVSGNDLHLTRNGDAMIGQDITTPLATYTSYDGTGDYFSHADDARLDITGAEAIIEDTAKGLTIGLWFYLDSVAADQGLMVKWNVTGDQRSYRVYFSTTNDNVNFAVSDDGTVDGVSMVGSNVATVSAGQWYFVAGRMNASPEIVEGGFIYIHIWLDGVKVSGFATEDLSSIFDSTAIFTLGETSATGMPLDGRIAHPFLCASALPDIVIETFYQMTSPLFGKAV